MRQRPHRARPDDRLHQFEHVRGDRGAASGCRSRSSRPSARSSCSRSRDPTASSPPRTSRPTATSTRRASTNALAKGATDRGATILRHTPVTALVRGARRLDVSTTPEGEIRAEHVVIAAGQWSREVGRLAGVELPIVPLQHHYLMTEPMPEIACADGRAAGLPRPGQLVLRAPGGQRPARRAVRAQPADLGARRDPGGLSRPAAAARPRADRGLPRRGRRAHPAFGETRASRRSINGPDGYTPDGRCLMGPVPGRTGLLRARRLLDLRHRLRRRRGLLRGGVDRRRPADRQHVGARRPPLRRLRERRPRTSSHGHPRCSRTSTRSTIPRRSVRPGRPLKTDPAVRPAAGEGRRHGRALRVGAAALVRARDRGGARRVLVQARQLVRRGRRGVPGGARRRSACSTRRASQSSWSRGPGAEAFLDRLCANRLPGEAGRMCADADAHARRAASSAT